MLNFMHAPSSELHVNPLTSSGSFLVDLVALVQIVQAFTVAPVSDQLEQLVRAFVSAGRAHLTLPTTLSDLLHKVSISAALLPSLFSTCRSQIERLYAFGLGVRTKEIRSMHISTCRYRLQLHTYLTLNLSPGPSHFHPHIRLPITGVSLPTC